MSVAGSEIARRLASPMLSRIAAQKDTEVIRVLGTMRGGMGFGEGGGKEMQVHTGDEKTTKRWEADDRARDRLKEDG